MRKAFVHVAAAGLFGLLSGSVFPQAAEQGYSVSDLVDRIKNQSRLDAPVPDDAWCQVLVESGSDGMVTAITVLRASGYPAFDRSIVRAIDQAAPLMVSSRPGSAPQVVPRIELTWHAKDLAPRTPKQDPAPRTPRAGRPEDYLDGIAKIRAGDYATAEYLLAAFTRDQADSPEYASALYWLGSARFAQRKYLTAAEPLNMLLRDYPTAQKAPSAGLVLGTTLIALKDREGGERAWQNVIDNYPGSGEAREAATRLVQSKAHSSVRN